MNYEAGYRVCAFDYTNKNMIQSLEYSVGCDEKCADAAYDFDEEDSPEAEQNVKECVEDCHNMIKEYSKGSFRVMESGEVMEANIPLDIDPFVTEGDEMTEYQLREDGGKQVLEKFEDLGCRPDPDIGFRHPHEFASTTAGSEPEEDPAAFALHIRGGSRGRCYLDDVLQLLRSFEGQEAAKEPEPKEGEIDYYFDV